jgi:hypothetical protein
VKTCLRLFLSKLAVGSVFLAGLAYSQAAPDPQPSAMVSSSASSIQPENIQPGTPAVSDTSTDAAIEVDPASLLPDLPPVPHKNATLIGGTLERLDRVRDQVTVRVFGGGRMSALFDPRTKVYRGSTEVTIADLRQGERIYLDTILDGTTVFARRIRLKSTPTLGESQGILLKYKNDEMVIRDGIAPNPVRIRLNPSTKFLQGERSVPASTLVPGSLIAVTFDPQGNGHDMARQVSILALPGTRYTFTGQVAHIDLRTGLLVITSSVDKKTYEVYLDPKVTPGDNLQPGASVTVIANFEDSRYVARTLTIDSQPK